MLMSNYQLIITIIIIISLINYTLLIYFKHHSKLFETVSNCFKILKTICNCAQNPTFLKINKHFEIVTNTFK